MTPPKARPRPKIAQWRHERNLSLVKTADLIEKASLDIGQPLTCSDQTVHLLCLPFDDERRRVPSEKMMAAIGHMSAGELSEKDFFQIRSVA